MPAIALRAALTIVLSVLLPAAFAQPVTWNDDFGPVTFKQPPRRVVVLDWGLVEQLLAIGVTPVGVGEPDGYRRWVSTPTLPTSVADVGARREPNLEAMSQLRPDLILATPEYASILPLLNAVAPTMLLATFDDSGQPLQRSRQITTLLGRMLDHQAQADALLKRVDNHFAEARAALAGQALEPLYLVTFLDERHLRVNGGQGLYQAVLDELGLRNAWHGPTSSWGFATITLAALATPSDARLVLFEPLPDAAALNRNPIWKALSAVREQRVDSLLAVWPYGGISSAERLALLLKQRFAPSAQP